MKKYSFLSGVILALVAFACLAPIYNPPSGTGGVWGAITGTLSSQSDLATALGLKAPLASPAFTGNPTAPTQTDGNNSTRIATTAYADLKQTAAQVQALIDASIAGIPAGITQLISVTDDASTSNTDGTEDDLLTVPVVANTLSTGQQVICDGTIIVVGSATANRRLKIYLLPAGASKELLWDSGTLTLSLGGTFKIRATISPRSTTQVRCTVEVITTSASTVPYVTYTGVTDADLSQLTQVIFSATASGTGAAGGDITLKMGSGVRMPPTP